VIITPGNHDPLTPGRPYSESAERGSRTPRPDNVFIISSAEFQTVRLKERPEITVIGQAFYGNSNPDQHPLSLRIERPTDTLNILLLHGSLLGGWTGTGKKLTFPFTRQELLAQDFAYVALGHYHAYDEIRDEQGRLRAAYGGRPFAAEFVPPERIGGCLVGEISPAGQVTLRRVSLDERRLLDLSVTVRDLGTPEDLRAAAVAVLSTAAGGKEDLVRLKFSGTYQPGLRIRDLDLRELAFAVTADCSGLRPGYDLEALRTAAETPGASLESLFVKALQERRETTTADEELLQEALEYGLDALHGFVPEPRDAN